MELIVHAISDSYVVKTGNIPFCLNDVLSNHNKVLIVTDENIPVHFYNDLFKNNSLVAKVVLKPGEQSKSVDNYLLITHQLIELSFAKDDYIVSIGGGVIGDLSGFVASTYKRGIHWVNVPTTTLSMIDSSIGGKTAIDMMNVKNVLGNFYNPDCVIIDTNTLVSLDKRQYRNGLWEAVKMGFLFDHSIIDLIINDYEKNIETIIEKCLVYKQKIVEKDFFDKKERHILNLGHTFGHAFEACMGLSNKLLHGEAVALGMYYALNGKQREELIMLFELLRLDYKTEFSVDRVIEFIKQDKKFVNGLINFVTFDEKGKVITSMTSIENIRSIMEDNKLWEVK